MSTRRSLIFWSVILIQVAILNGVIYALRLGLWPLAVVFVAILIGANLWALGRLRQKR